MAIDADIHVPIYNIVATKGQSVRLQVEDIPNDYNHYDHVVVIITHRAMMMSDFSAFHGWSIIIDETPVVLDRQDLQTSQSREFFERNYALETIHKSWASVTLTRDGWGTTAADLERDDCFRMLRTFHDRVTASTFLPDDCDTRMVRRAHKHEASRRAVIGNLLDWSDMEDGRRWTWWSLWSPHQLDAFTSVEIMANGFDKSLTFQMLRNLNPMIEWEEVKLKSTRVFANRRVRIEYFADQHAASQSMFETEAGQANLKAIARYLADRDQIWMANERHEEHLDVMGGLKLSPLQAGSNEFAKYHSAAAIYCAKPSAETRAVMTLLGVEPEVWTHSQEFEPILQFVCRTSIREPQSTETVTFAVYDKDQASYLASYFADQPYCDVEVEHISLSITDVRRQRGRKTVDTSVVEAEAKAKADREKRAAAAVVRRAKEKAAKVAAGEVRKPGRPKAVR
ncbi:hypothetical protein [Sphingomonas faeni]|uniref:hypothetical protein n=1 Tax=Sphingomonas faeni TaxID=185950 RepID=UPI0033538159